jgi:hypothetical protein
MMNDDEWRDQLAAPPAQVTPTTSGSSTVLVL